MRKAERSGMTGPFGFFLSVRGASPFGGDTLCLPVPRCGECRRPVYSAVRNTETVACSSLKATVRRCNTGAVTMVTRLVPRRSYRRRVSRIAASRFRRRGNPKCGFLPRITKADIEKCSLRYVETGSVFRSPLRWSLLCIGKGGLLLFVQSGMVSGTSARRRTDKKASVTLS